MKTPHPLALVALLTAAVAVTGCSSSNDGPVPAQTGGPPPVQPSPPRPVQTTARRPVAAPTPRPVAVPQPAQPAALPELVGPARSPGTRQKDTVGKTGGVLVGTPAGWKTENAYSEYDIATPPGPNEAFVIYEKAYGTVADGGDFSPDTLRTRAFTAHVTKATWGTPEDTVVGEGKYPAKILRGKGTNVVASLGECNVIAVVFEVPGKKPGFLMGSWLVSKPEHEENIREMLRAIAPCELKPQKGCVKSG